MKYRDLIAIMDKTQGKWRSGKKHKHSFSGHSNYIHNNYTYRHYLLYIVGFLVVLKK